jgi:hypothetical protein
VYRFWDILTESGRPFTIGDNRQSHLDLVQVCENVRAFQMDHDLVSFGG